MALLEGPPVIAEDLLEGVFVDSLSVVCHGRWLYHTLPPGSPACPHCPVPLPGLWREENRGSTKRKFLYAKFTVMISATSLTVNFPVFAAGGLYGSIEESKHCWRNP